MSPILAQNGPLGMSVQWSLTVGKQTLHGMPILVVNDPTTDIGGFARIPGTDAYPPQRVLVRLLFLESHMVRALKSVNFSYVAEEDRVLAAINPGDPEAWSCWLTRRLVLALLERAAEFLASTSH